MKTQLIFLMICINFVVTATWNPEEATREIKLLQKQLQETTRNLAATQKQIETMMAKFSSDLMAINARVVPVGSIYIEYFNQPSPRTLWPDLFWEDITNTYAGLFFRALGGDSGDWGANQNSCSPHISQVNYDLGTYHDETITLPQSGWSNYLKTGYYSQTTRSYFLLRFFVESCEVRPKNQAIKIWKRTE